MPTVTENEPRYVTVKNALIQQIKDGKYTNRLPATKNLAERFNVAYMTADRALKELVNEGIARREVGRGTFINPDPFFAPSLKSQTRTVGFAYGLIGDQVMQKAALTSPFSFFGQVLGGLHTVFQESGINVQCHHLHDLDQPLAQHREFQAASAHWDGMVILNRQLKNDDVAYLRDRDLKTVSFGPPVGRQNVSFVDTNNEAAGHMAMAHLLANGCRKVAVLDVAPDLWHARDRQTGINRAQAELGLGRSITRTFNHESWEHLCVQDAVHQLMETAQDTDGIIACSGIAAMLALEALKDKGKRVPEDVSLVLIGEYYSRDWRQASFFTSIKTNMADLATAAASIIETDLLSDQEGPAQSRVFAPVFHQGYSTPIVGHTPLF